MNKRKVICIVGIVVGAIFAVLGFVSNRGIANDTVSYAKFGADFYTDIHSATRHAFEAAQATGEIAGMILMAIGAFQILYFLNKMFALADEEALLSRLESNQDNQMIISKKTNALLEDMIALQATRAAAPTYSTAATKPTASAATSPTPSATATRPVTSTPTSTLSSAATSTVSSAATSTTTTEKTSPYANQYGL